MARQEKVTEVAELKNKLEQASSVYFIDFTQVGANDFNMVRRQLREAGAAVRVAKNRLALRAIKECGMAEGTSDFLRGPTSLVLGTDDPIAPARALRDITRKVVNLKVKGAYVDQTLYTADRFKLLAEMPTGEELRGILVGTLAAPIWELTLGLEQLLSELVYVTEEIAKRPGEAPTEAS